MKDAALVISLGRSPAVVTETVDSLLNKGVNLRRVYLVTTSEREIIDHCIPLLKEEFAKYPNYSRMKLIAERGILRNQDITDKSDNDELLKIVSSIVRDEKDRGSDVYIGMAGGRKSMSAVMAFVGVIFRAKEIIHVLVDPETEKLGSIDKLGNMTPEQRTKALHPENKWLISLPIISLIDYKEILDSLRQKRPVSNEIEQRLVKSGYKDSKGNLTKEGRKLKRLLEEIEASASRE